MTTKEALDYLEKNTDFFIVHNGDKWNIYPPGEVYHNSEYLYKSITDGDFIAFAQECKEAAEMPF